MPDGTVPGQVFILRGTRSVGTKSERLRAVGIPLEAAMTATFIFRAFTFWFPMLPGLVLARQELWRKPARIAT